MLPARLAQAKAHSGECQHERPYTVPSHKTHSARLASAVDRIDHGCVMTQSSLGSGLLSAHQAENRAR